MSEHSFTTGFTVDQTPREVFDAIANVRGWWTEDIEGGTARLDDEFRYRAEDIHVTRFRITEVVPGRRMVWHVLENHFDSEVDTEWADTTVEFDISVRDGRTEVRFTHRGLVPAYECYDNCSNAWGFFVTSSLRDLITTGTGRPNGPGRLSYSGDAAVTARTR
jgi:hypothetical protein